MVNILGFVRHRVSVATIQLCHCWTKAATVHMQTHGYGCIPIQLYLQQLTKNSLLPFTNHCSNWWSLHLEEMVNMFSVVEGYVGVYWAEVLNGIRMGRSVFAYVGWLLELVTVTFAFFFLATQCLKFFLSLSSIREKDIPDTCFPSLLCISGTNQRHPSGTF